MARRRFAARCFGSNVGDGDPDELLCGLGHRWLLAFGWWEATAHSRTCCVQACFHGAGRGPQNRSGLDDRVVAQIEQPRSGALSGRQLLQRSTDERGGLAFEHKLLGCRQVVGDIEICELADGLPRDPSRRQRRPMFRAIPHSHGPNRSGSRSDSIVTHSSTALSCITSSTSDERRAACGRQPARPGREATNKTTKLSRSPRRAPAPPAPRPTRLRHRRGPKRPSTHSANHEPIG